MIINKYSIPDDLILNYCRVIKLIENGSDPSLDRARKALHDKIFEHAGADRSLYRREDRDFNLALNNTVIDILEIDFMNPMRSILTLRLQ